MNDSLRRALFAARMTEEDLATHLEVDPKTVRRWLGGRLPYARHRQALANLLEVEESLLWPRVRTARQLDSELVAVYPDGLHARAWFAFFEAAVDEVDILHQPQPNTGEPNLARILERIPANIRTRVIVAESAIDNFSPQAERLVRKCPATIAHDIYRADGEMLVRQRAFGVSHSAGPIIHLVSLANPSGLFSTYTASFDGAWVIARAM